MERLFLCTFAKQDGKALAHVARATQENKLMNDKYVRLRTIMFVFVQICLSSMRRRWVAPGSGQRGIAALKDKHICIVAGRRRTFCSRKTNIADGVGSVTGCFPCCREDKLNWNASLVMTLITMVVSIATLLALLAAMGVALINRWYGEHFSTAIESRKVMEADGQERDQYSFTASRSNTFIGNTVGRVYVAFAAARFDRLDRKHRPLARA
jgi:hypothetical protein